MEKLQQKDEPGFALGFLLIGLLVVLLIAAFSGGIKTGPVQPGITTVLGGLYIAAWGSMFIASYYFSHKTFFFRGLIWVCEHISHPASRKMAFFYGALGLVIGAGGILAGLGLV